MLVKRAFPISPIGQIQPEWDLGNTKPSQNIQKTSQAIVLLNQFGTILLRNASICLNTEGKSRDEEESTGKLVVG